MPSGWGRDSQSRRGGRPVLVTAGGRGAQCAGSRVHETLHIEKGRGRGRRAASNVSAPGWGRGGLHEGQGRAEKYERKAIHGSDAASIIIARVTGCLVHSRRIMPAACTECRRYVTFPRRPPRARCQRLHALTRSREDVACLAELANRCQKTPVDWTRSWACHNLSPAGSEFCACRSLPLAPRGRWE